MSAQGRGAHASRRRARGVAAVAVPLAVVVALVCGRCGTRGQGVGSAAGVDARGGGEALGWPGGEADERGAGREAAPCADGPGADGGADAGTSGAADCGGRAEGSGGGASPAAGVGGGQAEVDERARAALASYRDSGEAVLAHAGYLDLLGSVWCCVVEGPGWVEIRLVGLDPASGEVGERTLRLDAEAWQEEMEAAGVEGG